MLINFLYDLPTKTISFANDVDILSLGRRIAEAEMQVFLAQVRHHCRRRISLSRHFDCIRLPSEVSFGSRDWIDSP